MIYINHFKFDRLTQTSELDFDWQLLHKFLKSYSSIYFVQLSEICWKLIEILVFNLLNYFRTFC